MCSFFFYMHVRYLGDSETDRGLGMLVWEFTIFFNFFFSSSQDELLRSRGKAGRLQKGPRRSRPLYPLTGFPPLFPLSLCSRPKGADGGGSG